LKRPKLEILESDDIREIVAAAYDLLENFGVMVDNEEALGILEDGGARVDLKEIMQIMKSFAWSKGVDVLPQIDGWVG
jgi:trimethylamine:corrinoid methyltransferase-like protein